MREAVTAAAHIDLQRHAEFNLTVRARRPFDLPKAFRPDTSARSFVVKTSGDLQNALSAPNDTMIFVESIMDPYDAPAAVISSSNKGAELDYGPRGPQGRDNLQLRSATYKGGRPVPIR
jgi:hypothetical protein